MNFGISFSPLVPELIVWVALAIAVALSVLLVTARARGVWVRIVAMALFVLALANPSLTREDRDPLTSVAAVVIDKSLSQELGNRTQQTEAVRAQLAERLGRLPGVEVRFVEAGQSDGETDGTRLFTALTSTLSDVRMIGSRARSSSPTAACTTCRPTPPRSASRRRCMR